MTAPLHDTINKICFKIVIYIIRKVCIHQYQTQYQTGFLVFHVHDKSIFNYRFFPNPFLSDLKICGRVICNEEDEDIEHFLLGCKILQCVRAPFLNELADILQGTYSKQLLDLPSVVCLQLILDCTKLYNHENHSWFIYNKDVERAIEHISRTMCYTLHSVRIRSLMKRK